MTDTFLLLTPLLVLAIVGLLGFLGCQWLLNLPQFIHAPTFDPPGGAYYADQMVKLEAPDADDIHYNLLDPANPAGNAVLHHYDGPIQISNSLTIKAVASKSGYKNEESTAKYYIGPILYQQGPAETSSTEPMTTSPFTNPLGQGNLVLVWVFYQTNSTAVQISAMTDGVNQYAPAAGPTTSAFMPTYKQEIWYAHDIQTVADAKITVSFVGASLGDPSDVQISAHEYTNNYQESDLLGPLADLPTAGMTDTNSNAPGNLVSSATVHTHGRKAFAAAAFEGSGLYQPPWASRSTIKNCVVEDMDVTSPGYVTALFKNTSPTRGWMVQIITLR